MNKINIDTFSYENAIEYIKTSVDAIFIADGAADKYKVLSKSGIFTDFIDDTGRYKDLIEKLWYHFNNSDETVAEGYHVFIPTSGKFQGKYSKIINISVDDITHIVQMTIYPIENEEVYLFILDELDKSMFIDQELTTKKVAAIQNTYLFSMYIDLVKDTTSSISVTEISDEVINQQLKYSDWRMMIVNMIDEKDQPTFLEKTDPEYLKKNFAPGRTSSFDCLMMNLEGKYIWVKLIFCRAETSNADDFRFVFMVQNIHENSLELLQTLKKYEQLASRDSLTGIFNHGRMETEIGNAITMKKAENKNISLMILDIDFFKHVNDKFGHTAGDVTLVKFTKVISDYIREHNAVLGRWGGEEFVIVWYDVSMEEALKYAEDIRCTIAKEDFGNIGQITCSIGVTDLHSLDTFDDAFNRMDRALYNAKSSGRNCVKSV
ncbi:MAG: GGDEF domain-containing protein [Ruminococcus sp.]|uniref:GGDEF domain-containing protein n=1 Tax=Ruminococcus sp. TaxID=41978 RepID=UPI001B286210|nr:GGDEF domain-containing protein [Ruminococcus sp.]MBO7474040.1 GGDEF domain-containing protein [Ruminococcus sp.]